MLLAAGVTSNLGRPDAFAGCRAAGLPGCRAAGLPGRLAPDGSARSPKGSPT